MFLRISAFIIGILFVGAFALAQSPTPTKIPAPAVDAPAGDVATDFASDVQPPDWVVSLVSKVESMPTVGPIVTGIFKWLVVVYSMLTLLVTFLLGVIKILVPALDATKVGKLLLVSDFLEAQQKSKWMYWLKFFSFFNAQKVDKPVAVAVKA